MPPITYINGTVIQLYSCKTYSIKILGNQIKLENTEISQGMYWTPGRNIWYKCLLSLFDNFCCNKVNSTG